MDNVVLYFDPATEEPLKIILLSYVRLIAASARQPLPLDGLAELPLPLRRTVLKLLRSAPVNLFLRLVEPETLPVPASLMMEVFTPAILKAIA